MNQLEALEWGRHYSDCFIRARGAVMEKEWDTYYVGGATAIAIDDAGDQYDIRLNLINLNASWRVSLSKIEVDLSYPNLGYVYIPPQALYVERRPDRQWKRGVGQGTTIVYSPFANLVSGLIARLSDKYDLPLSFDLPMSNSGVNHQIMKELWNRTTFSFEAATKALQEEKSAMVPLSNDLALSQHHINNSFLLWKYLYPIGEVKGKEIFIKERIFLQEVKDFLSRNQRYDIHVH